MEGNRIFISGRIYRILEELTSECLGTKGMTDQLPLSVYGKFFFIVILILYQLYRSILFLN